VHRVKRDRYHVATGESVASRLASRSPRHVIVVAAGRSTVHAPPILDSSPAFGIGGIVVDDVVLRARETLSPPSIATPGAEDARAHPRVSPVRTRFDAAHYSGRKSRDRRRRHCVRGSRVPPDRLSPLRSSPAFARPDQEVGRLPHDVREFRIACRSDRPESRSNRPDTRSSRPRRFSLFPESPWIVSRARSPDPGTGIQGLRCRAADPGGNCRGTRPWASCPKSRSHVAGGQRFLATLVRSQVVAPPAGPSLRRNDRLSGHRSTALERTKGHRAPSAAMDFRRTAPSPHPYLPPARTIGVPPVRPRANSLMGSAKLRSTCASHQTGRKPT